MKKLLGLLSIITSIVALGADYYVDSNAVADTATGSQAAPFTTLKAAVDAANAQYDIDGLPSTVYVKGGDACSYTIASSNDLITVTASNLTMCAWADYGAPKVHLGTELSVSLNNPKVITIVEAAYNFTIRGFEFYSYIDNNRSHSGTSLGQSGRVFSILGAYCVIEDCKFYQDNRSTDSSWGGVAIQCESRDGKKAYNLVVRNCYFSKFGKKGGEVIKTGNKTIIISCIFDDCSRCYKPQQYVYGCQFISNRVVNASEPIYSNGDNYEEDKDIEIAYNIFVNTTDRALINKSNVGLNNAIIHHNTIIGGKAFIGTRDAGRTFQWTPSFYNNLIILTDELSAIITEESSDVGATNPTTFGQGSIFRDNVWLAPNFNGGSAPLELEQYKLEADSADSVGLYLDNNLELSLVPEFIETEDIFSEDFYRLNSLRYSWAEGLNSSYGTEPAYIGAQEPIADAGEPGEFFSLNSFTAEADSFSPLSEITFSVEYVLNAGPVMVNWDFDGDGTYDYTASETSTIYAYPKAGVYTPTVKITDTATGKELTANLAMTTLEILRSTTYVDALAADDGDGTEERPYKTIAEAVAATSESGTIFVRGGEDRVYEINSADDFIYINKNWVTIKAWGDYGNAKVVISHTLAETVENPYIINIDLNAYGTIISDLDFVWYGSRNEEYPGDSLGTAGRVIHANGGFTTIKNCGFRQEGAYPWAYGLYVIGSGAGEHSKQYGQFLHVEGCTFEGITGESKQMHCVWTGVDPVLVQNTFTNCYLMMAPLKGHYGPFTFVSNALYECRSIQSNNPNGNYAEFPNADIGYNIFISSTGEPFITKTNNGLNGNVFIHHNTIIGASALILNTITYNDAAWRPQIFDNLILLADGGMIIEDNATTLHKTYTSSFTDETYFMNNAYIADSFKGGTAVNLEGYELTLEPVDCVQLDAAPRFMSTEMDNEDEYRMRATKFDWQYTTAMGGYPNYVGAVEPFEAQLGFLIMIK